MSDPILNELGLAYCPVHGKECGRVGDLILHAAKPDFRLYAIQAECGLQSRTFAYDRNDDQSYKQAKRQAFKWWNELPRRVAA